MTDRLPRTLLHAEGVVVPWWLLVVLALAPDLSMAGYAAGPIVGAAAYDVAHTYSLPVALAAIGVLVDADLAVQIGLVWTAHIGVDRAIGYGLKYRSGFKDTHLQRV